MTGSPILRSRCDGRTPWPSALGVGLILILSASVLGEGGSTPGVLLVWHGMLAALLLAVLAPSGRGVLGQGGALARGPLSAFWLFLLLSVVGAALAPYGYAAFVALLEIGAFLVVAMLAARCGPVLVSQVALSLLVVGAAEVGLVLWQRFGEGQTRPPGTFLNTNHLGAWLAAVLLLNLNLILTSKEPMMPRGARILLVLSAFAGLLLTESRGALLIGLPVGLLYLLLRAWRGLPNRARAGIVGGILVAAVLVGYLFQRRIQEADPYRHHRIQIWKASLGAVVEAPWTGTGPRQFAAASANLNFPDGEGPLRYDRGFTSTHSDLLRVPCEFGWPGALVMLAAVVLTGRELARKRRGGLLGRHTDGALAALLALGAQGAVENLSERPAIYLVVAVLLGSLLSGPRTASSSQAVEAPAEWQGHRTGASPFILPAGLKLAVVMGLLLLFLVGDVAPYLAWRQVSGLPLGRLDPANLQRLELALRLNPVHPDYWMRKAEHLAGTDWDMGRYAEAREAAERSIRLQPADARYRRRAALLEGLACRTLFRGVACRERAATRFREAEALSRYDALIPLELGKFLMDNGDPAGARRASERVLAIEPNAVPARLLLADALLAHPGSTTRAEELLAGAQEIAEEWEDRRHENLYAHELLGFDARQADRISRKIARLQGEVAGPAGRVRPTGGG